MSEFIPPVPPTRARKASLVRRFFEVRRSAISVLYERSYSMKMGKVRVPARTVFFVNEPGLVRRILVEEFRRYPKSNLLGAMLKHVLGESIFTTNGAVWERQRRMMNAAFEQARLQDVFPLMSGAVEALLHRLDNLAGDETVQIDAEMAHVTADIIYRTIFSTPLTDTAAGNIFEAFQDFQETAYDFGMLRLGGIPSFLYWRRQRRAAVAGQAIRRHLEQPVEARLKGEQTATQTDILAALVAARDPETGRGFDFKQLVDQVAVLFLAGHETSASALAWALYLVAMRPEVQDRVAAEAEAVLDGREPTFSDMRRLGFARDVFREALRLYPPVAFIARDVTEAEVMRDKRLKPGDMLIVSPYLIHRHRQLWERPDAFDPDRFRSQPAEESQRRGYLPFSLGPRVCVGAAFALQEGTLILASLLRRYRVLPDASCIPVPVARLTLRAESGIRLRLERR